MQINWNCKAYKELSLDEFHDIIQLREKVFVVEQDCPYLDVDGKDKKASHVYGEHESKVIATARILPPGISYQEVSIGRVVVDEDFRKNGIGVDLMKYTLEKCEELFPRESIRISAQTYLLNYYQSLGFQSVGEPYLEDNIPHIQMLFSK